MIQNRSFRPTLETVEPRILLAADLSNGVMELGTNLNFVFQEDHVNLSSYPTGNQNPNDTTDLERRPFVFRNGVDWDNAYDFDSNTGLSTNSPWRQEFLDDIGIYSQLRFIHWSNTNGSGVEDWGDRTLPTEDQTQQSTFGTANGVNDGVAWEWLIDLGNRTGKDIWINIPLKATDDYVQNLASLVNERLDPSLSIHVEYHNEIWLSKPIAGDSRTTTQYSSDMANAAGIPGKDPFDSALRWYAHRSARIWEIFHGEFDNFDQRVVKVVAGQTANVNVGEQIRDNLRNSLVNSTSELEDAYAIAPYFGTHESFSLPIDFGNLDSLAQAEVAQASANVVAWSTVGTPVIGYEGGQSVTGANATDVALHALNSDPQIKQIYLDYLVGLQGVGLESFNHFTHSGVKLAPTNDSDDAWGAKAYIGQPSSEAPKFAALAEFVGATPIDNPNLLFDGAIATFDAAGSVANTTSSIVPHGAWIDAVVAGDIVPGAGVQQSNGSYKDSFAPKEWGSLTLADAIASDEYVSFSVTATEGHELNVNALDLVLRSQDQARNFALLSSVDGFSESNVISDFGGPVFGDFGLQEVTLDLSQAGLDELEGTIEFRIYAYGGNPNIYESVGVGGRNGYDLKLFGQVVKQPTPLLVDEVIGRFDTVGSLRDVTTEIEAESSVVPVAVSAVSSGAGVTTQNSWYNNRFAPREWNSVTLQDAIANEDYLTFNVDVAAGYSLDVSEFEAYLFTQNSKPRNFALLSSATGFTSNDVVTDFGGAVSGTQYGQETRVASTSVEGLTGSNEFRIYVFGSQNTNPWEAVGLGNRIGDELVVKGTLSRDSDIQEVVVSGPASDFDTQGSIRNSTTEIVAEETSTLFTTTGLAAGPGLNATNSWFNDRFAPIGWNSATLDDAISNQDYLTFSLDIAAGASVDLNEIDAYLFTQNKRSRNFALMSSVTGFTTADVLTDFGGAVTGSSSYGQEGRVADLSGAGLNGLSGSIEFRIYVYGSVNAWEAVGIGNRLGSDLTLSGDATL